MKTLRQRLVVAFLGIAIAVLSIFGTIANYIAVEYGAETEIHTLSDFTAEKAARLAAQVQGKSIHEVNTVLTEQNGHTNLPVFLLDSRHHVVAGTPMINRFDISLIDRYFADLPPGKTGGIIQLKDTSYMWSLSPVPDTSNRLVVFHGEDQDVSFVEALGVKLFFAALLVIWVTVWAALILAAVISKRLDEQNAILVHQSLYDQLTDLPNRRQLFEQLQQAIYHARKKQYPVALLLFELVNLKEINDTLGHQSGDALLRQIGPRLKSILRDSDLVARLEGSEFALLLPGLETKHIAVMARKILLALEQPFIIDELELEARAALGVAVYPEHSDTADTLLRQADVAMCLARCHGSEYVVYTPESDPHSLEQLTLMSELRQAINNHELQLFYQPKLDLRLQQIVGVEALIRWFHPQRGLIMPDEFIPKAEQTGLIKPLTKWIIEHAFKQSHAWAMQGLNLQIAVNVSQRSLYDRELINQIADTMQHLGIGTCTLDIEITETAIMAQPEQSMDTLQMLHAMGVHLAIDDFGTGFTSLAYLKELPVDELKIDKSFIMSMLKDGKDVMIVRSIIELAHSLGRVVVAEGVESEEILNLLRTLNCDTAQGYYLSKPLPAVEFEQWLNSSRWRPAIGLASRA